MMKNHNTDGREPVFKVGDVVCLLSGGEWMTIEVILPYAEEVHPSIGYFCVWFYNGDVQRAEFSEKVLRRKSRTFDL